MTHDDITARTATVLDYFRVARDAIDSAERHGSTLDRERIGELERDLAHVRAEHRSLDVVYTKVIGALQDELAQNAAITETLRAELAALKERGPWKNGAGEWASCSGCGSTALVVDPNNGAARCMSYPICIKTPVVEEEQGPWVIYDPCGSLNMGTMFAGDSDFACTWGKCEWANLGAITPWAAKAVPEYLLVAGNERVAGGTCHARVITLAEARRIAGAK